MRHILDRLFLGKSIPPAHFVGREKNIDNLIHIIENGGNAELIGPHRSGKSALCTFLSHVLSKKGKVDPYIVSLQHLKAPRIGYAVSDITQKPVDKKNDILLKDFENMLGGQLSIGGSDTDAVNQLVEFVKTKKKPIVIFFDEMDLGVRKDDLYDEWNSSLRNINHQSSSEDCPDISIIKVFSVNPNIYELEHHGYAVSRAVTSTDLPVRIQPLTGKQAKDFFNSKIVTSIVPDDFALEFTGTHPFLIEIFAYNLNKYTENNLNYVELINNVYSDSESFYKDLYMHIVSLDNRHESLRKNVYVLAFKQVLEQAEKITPKETFKFKLDVYEAELLKKLGVVIRKNDEDKIFSYLFSSWLARNAIVSLNHDDDVIQHASSCLGKRKVDDFVALINNCLQIGVNLEHVFKQVG